MRQSTIRFVFASAALVLAATACGGGGGAPDMGAPSTTYPAPHSATMPQIVKNGGSVAAAPVLIPVTYANDPYRAQIDDFVSKIGSSTYWSAIASEYGIGAATMGSAVHLTMNAPTSTGGSAIDADLTAQLNAANPKYPHNAPGVIYLLFFPSTTSISDPQTGTACQDYGAYHTVAQLTGSYAAYALIPRCAGGGGFTDLDMMTFSASHEIIEAATDPYFGGYDGANDGIWDLMSSGGEVGDYCEYQPDIFAHPTDIGYYVQRSWSNTAAAKGHNPCEPFSTPYFMAAPVFPDTQNISVGQGSKEPAKGIKLALNQSRTIELDLYSDADTGGPFTIEVKDLAALSNAPAELSFTLDKDSGVNGEKRHLTIKRVAAPSAQVYPDGSIFFIIAIKGQHEFIWPAIAFP